MTTLIEFLLARLDEDEAVARSAGGDSWCGVSMREEGGATREQANHILRWDPARILAEVAFKRKLLGEQGYGGGVIAEWIQRDMAQVYADHPDYDSAWA